MWVPPAVLRHLAVSLRASHGELLGAVPPVVAAMGRADWQCGAGDAHRHEVSLLVRRAEDAQGELAAAAAALDHVATEAELLLDRMRRAREAERLLLEQTIADLAAAGLDTTAVQRSLADLPSVPSKEWLGRVAAPRPPVLILAAASQLLPDRQSPPGRFSVDPVGLASVEPALQELAGPARSAAGQASLLDDFLLWQTESWGLGGGRVLHALLEVFGPTRLGGLGDALDELAVLTRVVTARIVRANGDDAALLAQFGTAAGFSAIRDQLAEVASLQSMGPDDPRLPIDLDEVTALLATARDAGLDPKAYGNVLRQYWFLTAAAEAGIDVGSWDPSKGAYPNAGTIERAYAWYGRTYLAHPDLQWLGLANMVGPGFAGSFYDLDLMGQVSGALSKLPFPVGPPGVNELAHLSKGDLQFYENTFVSMQKQIFTDVGGMHEAYLKGGITAVNELFAANLIDRDTYTAWQGIDAMSGRPQSDVTAQRYRHDATIAFATREQGVVIGDDYDRMRDHLPTGEAFTWVAGLVGAPSVPGAKSPAQFAPLSVSMRQYATDLGLPSPVHLRFGPYVQETVKTPLPGINISEFDPRMQLIKDDTVPVYEKLVADRGPEGLLADGLITTSQEAVHDRVEPYRLQHRLDDLAEQMLSWHASISVHGG